MKARLVFALLASAASVFASYTYDYSFAPYSSQFAANGYIQYSYLTTFPYEGSAILLPAVSGNPNDYEVSSQLYFDGGVDGTTFVHFLRASSSTVVRGSGSYISVEYTPATAQIVINQCVNGVVTQLGSTGAPYYSDWMSFRTVVFGSNLWVYMNNTLLATQTVPLTSGNGGFGGGGMPSGTGFYEFTVQIGHHDAIAPTAISQGAIRTNILPTRISFMWPSTTDDSAGIGMYQYLLQRSDWAAPVPEPAMTLGSDDTVQPGTTYTYQVGAEDQHGNIAWTPFTITTPPAGAVDPRRVGVRPAGSYWGGGGEQIDTLSGNLSFSVSLGTAIQRTGGKIPINLSYNSQNWSQVSGTNWQLGEDVGYGYGWKLQIGSLTPYYTDWTTGVDHYVFIDGSSSEYHLTVNNSGVWSSTEGIYVWFDSNTGILHFPDGSLWIMGCTSAASEPDAGTMYPTLIEDPNGNQIVATYMKGTTYVSRWLNGSARLLSIATVQGTYNFTYNTDSPVPHLTQVTGFTSTYGFTYASAPLSPPFGSDPNYATATTSHLVSMSVAYAAPYQFTYDSAGAGELLQATLPYGGHLRWTYNTFQYAGSRSLREVASRYLAADSAGATEWAYTISRNESANPNPFVHANMTLVDASGVGAKTWNFQLPGSGVPVWQIGKVSQFVQQASQGGTVLQSDTYGWAQDPAGNPYIASKTTVINPGASNQQTSLTQQTLDQYGNVLQSEQYPYNNTTTPVRTYNNTYLSGGSYAQYYVFNKLLNSTLTTGGTTTTLVANTYNISFGVASGIQTTGGTGYTWALDGANAVPVQWRGLVSRSVTPAVTTTYMYWDTGMIYLVSGSDGSTFNSSSDPATSWAAPMSISTESYSAAVDYTSWLGISQTTGANGETVSTTYDYAGRPATSVSAYGATTTYTYGTASGSWYQTKTTNATQAKTTTTLDGMGRVVRVATLAGTVVQSYVDTVYAPCACSPLGKINQVSQPYAPGQTPAWTVYTYDGMGRTLAVQQPDGASTTTYSYSGNQSTVTDPAGSWKQFTTDVLSNLVTVVEPDPSNQPSGTLTTSYTYDWMNHVTQVSMPRAGATQTRTFVYDNIGRLTSATNPENGTVSYYYNSNNTLQYKRSSTSMTPRVRTRFTLTTTRNI